MYDLIIKNCSVMMPDFSIKKEQDILIQDSFIMKITDTDDGYESKEVPHGKSFTGWRGVSQNLTGEKDVPAP